MSAIEVFEPAMCCSTGVCGPDVPQELVTFSADLDWLRAQGTDVSRYNLASEPVAFTDKPAVLDFLQVSGSEGLPLVLVNGTIAMAGRYPSRAELERWAGTAQSQEGQSQQAQSEPTRSALPMAAAGGCCSGGGSC